jgi:hypothetical protein
LTCLAALLVQGIAPAHEVEEPCPFSENWPCSAFFMDVDFLLLLAGTRL